MIGKHRAAEGRIDQGASLALVITVLALVLALALLLPVFVIP